MIIRVEQLPCQKVAYLRRVGAYGEGNFALMEQIKAWASKNRLLGADAVIYGVAWDNPALTAAKDCRYDACLATTDQLPPSSEVQLGELAAGAYAVFTINHVAEEVAHFWTSFADYLSTSKYLLDASRPILERYRPQLMVKGFCEFCVPVQ